MHSRFWRVPCRFEFHKQLEFRRKMVLIEYLHNIWKIVKIGRIETLTALTWIPVDEVRVIKPADVVSYSRMYSIGLVPSSKRLCRRNPS